jgi:hypothetical protein
MAQHNATGRNHIPSKAERQAALALNKPKPESRVDAETQAEIDAELQNKAAPDTPPPAPQTEAKKTEIAPLKPIDPNKGAATRDRWSACLKARPGAKLYMGNDIKQLPPDSIITTLKAGNPKLRGSATRYDWVYNGEKGFTTTIKAVVAIYEKKNKTAKLAYDDIAWDINHQFLQVEVVEAAPVEENETKPDVTEAVEQAA